MATRVAGAAHYHVTVIQPVLIAGGRAASVEKSRHQVGAQVGGAGTVAAIDRLAHPAHHESIAIQRRNVGHRLVAGGGLVDEKLRAISHAARSETLTVHALAVTILTKAGPHDHHRSIGQHGHIGIRLHAGGKGVCASNARSKVAVGIKKPNEDIRRTTRAGFPCDHPASVGQQGHAGMNFIDIRQVLAGHQRRTGAAQVGIEPLHQHAFALAVGRGVLPHDKSPVTIRRSMRILLMTGDVSEQRILAA